MNNYNEIINNLEFLSNTNEIVNYFKNIDDNKLDDNEYQDILEKTANKCSTSTEVILSCLELPDNTDFESHISEETVNHPEPEECEPVLRYLHFDENYNAF